jgi:protein-S-isoprenylcysteine O-methyltransferase Ste14
MTSDSLMKQLIFVFLLLYAVERLLETFWKREKLDGKIFLPYSFPLILTAYITFYLLVLFASCNITETEVNRPMILVSMAMVLISIFGRNWAIHVLGLYHSVHIEIRDQHRFLQTGPYRYVRNPYYLSNVIEALGLTLLVDSSAGVLISFLTYIVLLIHRMISEENALEQKFEGTFIEYKSRVPMIIPRCVCDRASIVSRNFNE